MLFAEAAARAFVAYTCTSSEKSTVVLSPGWRV